MSQKGDWFIKISKKARLYVKITGLCLLIAATIFSYYFTKRPIIDLPADVRVLAAQKNNCKLADSYKKLKDYVVKIENKTEAGVLSGNGFFDKNGYLVTNSHVVDKKGEIKVVFPDGINSSARLIANNQYKDLAILAVDREEVTSLPWGDTAKLDVNQELAFVESNDYAGKKNVAILTARKTYDSIFFLQTDIGTGDEGSGAPLINACGEVVGVSLYSKDSKTNLSIDATSADEAISELMRDRKIEYVGDENKTLSVLSNSEVIKQINTESTTVKSSKEITTIDTKAKNDDTPPKGEAAPSCSAIQTDKMAIDVDDEILLSFSYKGADGDITWAGAGNFSADQDQSDKSSIVKWSYDKPGKYDLSATAKNKFGECKQMISMSVNQPHISGLLAATGETLVKGSDGKYYAEVKIPIVVTATGTSTKNYSIVATSPTGYGGSVSGTITNQMTFVPPVVGTYVFTLTGHSGTKGSSIEVNVQNVIGKLSITGSALLTDSAGNNYAKVNTALTITASNTINKNYSIVATSATGYGGSVSGTVTNQMTFVPPVVGKYTFTLTSASGLGGFSISVTVQDIVGTISVSGTALTKDAAGNYYSRVGVPIVATVTNTLNKNFL